MTDLWQQTLAQLRPQMTAQTFDTSLAKTSLVSEVGDTLTIHADSALAVDWLENRLRKTVERTASAVWQRRVSVLFVNGASAPPSRVEEPAPEAANDDAAALLAQFDQIKNNWVKHPRYLSLFYQPYFSSFGYFAGSRALGVWQFIRDRVGDTKYDKAWTPVWEVTLKELSMLTGHGPHRLNGVWRVCPVFAQALEAGQAIACCGRYGQARRDETSCRYWQPGILQLLAEHVLLAIQKTGTSNRNTRLFVQIYQRPMLLTPWQVSQLGSQAQAAHKAFLLELGVDFDLWQRIEQISLASVWFDRTGLALPAEGDAVLSLNRLNKFFLPLNRVYLDAIGDDLDPEQV